MRIGCGFDAHRFAEGRRLVLGGVEIPHPRGMLAHSDGDVAIHALCDALLGAIGRGDIGRHFPDSDAAWKNADSRDLLGRVMRLVSNEGYAVVNADLTLIAQEPRLAPHLEAMCATLGALLGVSPRDVNVKATTTEGMGFTGRGEGIAAQAVVLIGKSGI